MDRHLMAGLKGLNSERFRPMTKVSTSVFGTAVNGF